MTGDPAARRRPRLTGRDWAADAGLCLLVTGITVLATHGASTDESAITIRNFGSETLSLRLSIGLVLAVAGGLALIVRRRWPITVLVVVEAALLSRIVLVSPDPQAGSLSLLVAVYTVATLESRMTAIRAAVAVLVVNGATLLGFIVFGTVRTGTYLIFATILVAGAWALGDNIGTRRAYLAALEERARRLEREQQDRAERAVVEERTRIARELHDVVAHHVSAIAVQAGAAEEIAERDPPRARQALALIQAASRQALTEMRAIVGILRDSENGGVLTPQPGLAAIERLVAQSRAAGLDVGYRIEGTSRPIPEPLDVSAYRIVQEALTNTLKHAGASRADIVVRYGDDSLDITVTDDGAPGSVAALPGAGRGLPGMRERVALFHGRLDVGRTQVGGFSVHARLPLDSAPA